MLADASIHGERSSTAACGRSRSRAGFCLRSLGIVVLAVGLAAWVKDSHALLWGDRFEPFVAETFIHDDNVFRISGKSDPTSVLGSSSKGDSYYTTSVGLNFDVPVSRQRFLGGLSWNDNRYDRYTVLDFTEHHGRALWQWQAGDELSGELGYANDRALSSLANVQGGIQSSTPNGLEMQKAFVNSAYMLTPRWRVRGELKRLDQANGVAERQVDDITDDGIDLTLSYITPAQNQIGVGVQMHDANLPNRQAINGALVDNSYRQNKIRIVAEWSISGHSRLSASVGQVHRRFAQISQRDYEGGIYRAEYEWKPTGKLTFLATALRDISAPDEINAGVNVGFVFMKAISLRPTFRVSEKVNVSGALEVSDWNYLGDPGLVLGTVVPRTDRVRTASLAISYLPLRTVRLELGLRHETRSSTFAFGDYVAEIVSVSARLGF